MIRRDKRNIGKLVRVRLPGSLFDGFTGRITLFRGNKVPGVPWVVIGGYTFGGDFDYAISTEEERQ